MKKIVALSFIICIIVGISILSYNFLIGLASEKIMDHVIYEILDEQAIEELLLDPKIAGLVQSLSKDVSTQDTLPFTTKEDGVKLILTKFSVGEIKDIAVQAQGGLTPTQQKELANQLTDRLTDDEIEALMIIGLAELQKQLLNKTE